MRVLVTWGSKRGGTEGIARIIGEELKQRGADVELLPAAKAARVAGFDAVVIGGSIYANRWHPTARRFVDRHESALRRIPVWFFSSGPLDDSAERESIAPTRQVQTLMARVGALGHATFGGRLAPDTRGFPASAMAKTHAGDWRQPARIRAWASEVASQLATARPGVAVDLPGRSLPRLVLHGLVGWAFCAAVMGTLLSATSLTVAVVIHAVVAPLVFAAIAFHYFREPGARAPLPTALAFVGIVALLDFAVVAGAVQHSLAIFGSVAGTWLPFALILVATWGTGAVISMLPSTDRAATQPPRAPPLTT
jgi:menaquinone-dependent protoporphyrinogen oxidase